VGMLQQKGCSEHYQAVAVVLDGTPGGAPVHGARLQAGFDGWGNLITVQYRLCAYYWYVAHRHGVREDAVGTRPSVTALYAVHFEVLAPPSLRHRASSLLLCLCTPWAPLLTTQSIGLPAASRQVKLQHHTSGCSCACTCVLQCMDYHL